MKCSHYHVCDGSSGPSGWLPAGRSPHWVLRRPQDCGQHRPERSSLHWQLVRPISCFVVDEDGKLVCVVKMGSV
ncbi:hypothetical protein XENOCAPTIV_021372 [Xenoophorus captivus]|uniref:Uncharacterized protein n=1 Tax=Xenoophorus captivus TaxID=1517983 RepID=A0ABV0RD24_9TELE